MPKPLPLLTAEDMEDRNEAAMIIQDWWVTYHAHKKLSKLQEALATKK